jgi:hypothetical protein
MVSSLFDRKAAGSFLTHRALIGALTAAREAGQAYDVATAQAQRERLPRLVLLDSVRASRTGLDVLALSLKFLP